MSLIAQVKVPSYFTVAIFIRSSNRPGVQGGALEKSAWHATAGPPPCPASLITTRHLNLPDRVRTSASPPALDTGMKMPAKAPTAKNAVAIASSFRVFPRSWLRRPVCNVSGGERPGLRLISNSPVLLQFASTEATICA